MRFREFAAEYHILLNMILALCQEAVAEKSSDLNRYEGQMFRVDTALFYVGGIKHWRQLLIIISNYSCFLLQTGSQDDTIKMSFQKEGGSCMWLLFAIGSAVFAALTSILAKVGIEGVNSNLATAIRTFVVLAMAWGMVFLTHAESGLSSIGKKSWLFLILSGLCTGASWLCYYRALQVGEASKVVPVDKMSTVLTLILAFIFLHETINAKSIIGMLLLTAGTLVMVIS